MGELAKRMVDRSLLRREAGAGVLDTVLDQTVGALTEPERTELLRLLTKSGGA